MEHLNDCDPIEISAFFDGSLSKLFLVKGQNALIVKSLKPEYCADEDLKSRFMYEVDILKSLHHQRTPQLLKSDFSQARPYFAYEYIKGMSLETLLINNTVTRSQCLDITRQLLTLLSDLHDRDQPVIHSDISPGNIIYSKHRHVHLIDFGCAKQLSHKNDMADTWIGKHAYLSPEQAQGREWGVRSDLYQVGLLVFEMLAGKRRNTGTSISEMLPLAANPAALELDKIDHRYHPFLNKILSIDIDSRFQSCAEALLELNKV